MYVACRQHTLKCHQVMACVSWAQTAWNVRIVRGTTTYYTTASSGRKMNQTTLVSGHFTDSGGYRHSEPMNGVHRGVNAVRRGVLHDSR